MAGQLLYSVILSVFLLVLIIPQMDTRRNKAEKKLRALIHRIELSWNRTDRVTFIKSYAKDAMFYIDDVPEPIGPEFLTQLLMTYAGAHFDVTEIRPICGQEVFVIVAKMMLYNDDYTKALNSKAGLYVLAVKKRKGYVIKDFCANTINVNLAAVQPIFPRT